MEQTRGCKEFFFFTLLYVKYHTMNLRREKQCTGWIYIYIYIYSQS